MFAIALRWLKKAVVQLNINGVLILIGAFFAYCWHVGSLTPGLSSQEVASRSASQSLGNILDHPLYAPQHFLQHIVLGAGYRGATSMRLISVTIALIILISLYILLRNWFGSFIGTLGILMLATTPWFILVARNATPSISLLLPLSLVAIYSLLREDSPRAILWLILAFAAAVSLYSPGGIELVAVWFTLCFRQLKKAAGHSSYLWWTGAGVLFAILSVPLIFGLTKNIDGAHSLLLIPSHWQNLNESVKSIGWSGLSIFLHAPYPHPFTLSRLPMLDAVQVTLVFFGAAGMIMAARKEAVTLFLASILIFVFSGLNQSLELLTIILPIVSILTAAGLRYLYVQWRSIFPTNPFAHALVIGCFSMLIGLHILFGIRYAIVAWPHSPATKAAYVLK